MVVGGHGEVVVKHVVLEAGHELAQILLHPMEGLTVQGHQDRIVSKHKNVQVMINFNFNKSI